MQLAWSVKVVTAVLNNQLQELDRYNYMVLTSNIPYVLLRIAFGLLLHLIAILSALAVYVTIRDLAPQYIRWFVALFQVHQGGIEHENR